MILKKRFAPKEERSHHVTVFLCVLPCHPCYHSHPTLGRFVLVNLRGGELGVLLHKTVKESGLMGKQAEKLHRLLLNNPIDCPYKSGRLLSDRLMACSKRVSSCLPVHHGLPQLYWCLGKLVAPPCLLWISFVLMIKVREMPILCQQFLRLVSRWQAPLCLPP